ncbi:hypothetical protein TWF694_005032 [Orbilia ellipsospora]|uniref:F-box domain-containing protein n=1 Tax=Orbilia ellipsospora TaxID=2528407 RepID=A0AAV9WUE0_9PEZI
MILHKIVCLATETALVWPQALDNAAIRRQIIMKLVQFLLRPEDSAVVVERQPLCYKDPIGSPLYTLPPEICLVISDYLDDLGALCFALTSKHTFNSLLGRIQNIICPLSELGCWAGKALLRAEITLNSDQSDVKAGMTDIQRVLWNNVVEARMLDIRKRGDHTIFNFDNPRTLHILGTIAKDPRVPQVIRRYIYAILSDTEYENMFQKGVEYIIRNLDMEEYIEFPSGKLERLQLTEGAEGSQDDPLLIKIPHPGEKLLEAITWVSGATSFPQILERLEKGVWVVDSIDLVRAHEMHERWKKLVC